MKLICSICKINEKSCMLPCGHMFCRECIDKNMEARQRFCPLDKKKIGTKDVQNVYLVDEKEARNR